VVSHDSVGGPVGDESAIFQQNDAICVLRGGTQVVHDRCTGELTLGDLVTEQEVDLLAVADVQVSTGLIE